jgi:aldehyde dehydrogenase (NAD+)
MTSDIGGRSASAVDYGSIVAELRAGFEVGLTRPIGWRLKQLDGLTALLTEHEADIAAALMSDLGKSAPESYLTETGLTLAEVRHVRRWLRWWLRPRPIRPTLLTFPSPAYTVREPLGVCLVIAPWNYPLHLCLAPLVGALAGGNACLVKPSEQAPATAELLATLVPRYLDPRAVQVVTGGVPETTALLRERFDHIFYTGNGRVARIVAQAAAAHLTPTTLELGGKCPVFVDGTTDLRVAAERIAWAKWTNAGQTCVAPDYVLASPTAADRLERLIPQAAQRMFGDDPHRSPDYGRIVTDAQHARLLAYLPDGRVVSGGHYDPRDRYLEPTVLADVSPHAAVMQEEIFGPILPILRVADAGAAIAFINGRDKPLALYVFTSDAVTRRRFVEQTSSGALTFGLPLAHFAMTDLPFGGVGASGTGAYHGRHSVVTFTHEKPVVLKPDHPDTSKLAYPPLTELRMRIARRVMG